MTNPIWILYHLSMVNKVIDFMSFNYDNVQMFSKTKAKDRSYCEELSL